MGEIAEEMLRMAELLKRGMTVNLPYVEELLREGAEKIGALERNLTFDPKAVSNAARIHTIHEMRGCVNRVYDHRHGISKDMIFAHMYEQLDALEGQEKDVVFMPTPSRAPVDDREASLATELRRGLSIIDAGFKILDKLAARMEEDAKARGK